MEKDAREARPAMKNLDPHIAMLAMEPSAAASPVGSRETLAMQRERILRRQLERTVEVLHQTRHSFHSKQLKRLREEIEGVLTFHDQARDRV